MRVPKRFPLAARPGFRSTTLALADPTVRSPVSDAALINAYAELDPEDNQYWVEKRLGTETLATVSGTAGGVGVAAAGFGLAIFGPNLWLYVAGTLTNVPYGGSTGHTLITGRAAQFLDLNPPGVGPSSVWCVNGGMWQTIAGHGHGSSAGYIAVQDATVSHGGVPWTVPLCDGCVILDGVVYVMDQTGNIWGSNNNDFSTWLATTVILAGGRDDIPVALVQQLEYVVALKKSSFRCFYDAGAAAQTLGVGSNLAWVEGADGNFGCANAGSVQLIDQSLLWLSNNDKNTPQIVRMDGLQVQVVSTPIIERLLQQLPMATFSSQPSLTTNIVYSSGIKRGGHRLYVLTALQVVAGATPFTLVYDLDQQLWYSWMSTGFPYWSVTSASAHGDDNAQGVFAQDINSGLFYATDIDQVYPTDSGIPCQVDIYTPSSDVGTKRRKTLTAMYFQNDQVSGSVMYVRKTDNDYRSWSPFRRVSLSIDRPNLTRCGTFTKRALNLRHHAATPFRIKAADLQMDIGTI